MGAAASALRVGHISWAGSGCLPAPTLSALLLTLGRPSLTLSAFKRTLSLPSPNPARRRRPLRPWRAARAPFPRHSDLPAKTLPSFRPSDFADNLPAGQPVVFVAGAFAHGKVLYLPPGTSLPVPSQCPAEDPNPAFRSGHANVLCLLFYTIIVRYVFLYWFIIFCKCFLSLLFRSD